MSLFPSQVRHLFLGMLAAVVFALPAFSSDWEPIVPEELKMTSEPLAPGASAIFLYRQVDRDDRAFHEYDYSRIKILTEEGRKYGNIEISFVKGYGNIRNIRARIIRPDGSILDFDGKVYEKTIVKARGLKVLAKTFTLPEVQVGSIIEYRFEREEPAYTFDSRWILSEDLFTKHARFSLKSSDRFALRWSWPLGLPPGTENPRDDKDTIRLEVRNVPAFELEDYMPPQNQVKYRVDFVYAYQFDKDSDRFWKMEGTRRYLGIENFIDKPKAMEAADAQILSPSDTAEVKLQKIYARTQQIRNLSFEREKTAGEQRRDKLEKNSSVGDIWKHGYANGYEITWLFLALVRAAGFEAYPVLVSTRDQYFFDPKFMNTYQLNDNAVLVKLDGKDLYFAPGMEFTPYGLLPWQETAVPGLRLNKDGGIWIKTSLPAATESRIERKASLRLLADSGDLEGTLTVTFTGLQAQSRRITEREEDDAARKKFLEEEVKESIPVEAEVDLTNKPDWSSSSPTLESQFHLKIHGWTSAAGRRQLIAVGLFGKEQQHVFEHAYRVNFIYFHFPFELLDDVILELPPGWQIDSLPPAQTLDGKVVSYGMTTENKNGAARWTRQLTVDTLMLPPKYYQSLRNFYQQVRAGDGQQIVLLPQ
jgi:hypothetical protein